MAHTTTKKFDKKIRTKLLYLVLSVTTAVLLCLEYVTYKSSYDLLAEATEKRVRNEIEIAIQQIESWTTAHRRAVEVLAAMEARGIQTNENRDLLLNDLATAHGARAIYIGSTNGEFVSSNKWEPPKDWDFQSRPWYAEAVKSSSSIVTEPYTDASPPYQKIISFASAIQHRGEVKGVVGMDVPFETVLSIVQELRIGKYSRSFLFYDYKYSNDTSTILGSSDGELKNQEFLQDFLSKDIKIHTYVDDKYRVFGRVAGTGLVVAFNLPISEVSKSLVDLRYIFITGILAALLVLTIAVSLVSTIIAKPILAIAEGATQVAGGNYEVRLPIKSRDELGLVCFHFNGMAEGLQEKELIRSTFGRYVSPEAVDQILNGKTDLGGEKKLVTVQFCDLRHFTAFAETCEPEELVETLNAYFSKMDEIIRKHGGSINRYLGDGILALYGAPMLLENSAQAAAEASIEMQSELQVFNEEHGTSFLMGIGIHTGVAIVGNVGSQHHTEYTVMGNTANLASRIEGLTKVYGESILVSEATSALLPSGMFGLKLIDRVRAVGKKDAVTLFALYSNEAICSDLQQTHRRIVEKYLQGDFSGTVTQILELDVESLTPHLELILARCKAFSETEPLEWDGAFSFHEK